MIAWAAASCGHTLRRADLGDELGRAGKVMGALIDQQIAERRQVAGDTGMALRAGLLGNVP